MKKICLISLLFWSYNSFSQNNDSTKIYDYFLSALEGAQYPQDIEDSLTVSFSSANYHLISVYDTTSVQTESFESFFSNKMVDAETGEDSLLAIVQGVYQISNYGFLFSANNGVNWSSLSEEDQYILMRDGNFNCLCGQFSNFCVNVCEHFGFSAVEINVGIQGNNGDVRGHTFTSAKSGSRWFVLETTTGQMVLNQNGEYLSYHDLILKINNRTINDITSSPIIEGKFLQPGRGSIDLSWPYGEEQLYIVQEENTHSIVRVKRSLDLWENNLAVQKTYLQYLFDNGYERRWLYMYNPLNIGGVYGEQNSVESFNNDILMSVGGHNGNNTQLYYQNPIKADSAMR